MAAVPPLGSHCSVLHLEQGFNIRQGNALERESIPNHPKMANVTPLCALSRSGEVLALSYNDGFVSIRDR